MGFKGSQRSSRGSRGRFKRSEGVSGTLQVFQGAFGDSRGLRDTLRDFIGIPGDFRGISESLRRYQEVSGAFLEVSRDFCMCVFKGVSGDPREPLGSAWRTHGLSGVFKGVSGGIRVLKGYLEVSRGFK